MAKSRVISLSNNVIARPEGLVTGDEIAKLLSVKYKWVLSACRLYDLPYYQVGRYKRFSPTEVMAWLEQLNAVGRVHNNNI